MVDDRLKEKVQGLLCDDLNPIEKDELNRLLQDSKELQNYYHNSKLSWEKLGNLEEVEPSNSYMSSFWIKVAENKKKSFWSFEVFHLNWKFAGSFSVFLIAVFFSVNYYLSTTNEEISFNSEEEEILNQLDN
ncbi:MAG: hypothetical protein ACRENO_02475, partial [Thermodesulfobacteriota bacterium]